MKNRQIIALLLVVVFGAVSFMDVLTGCFYKNEESFEAKQCVHYFFQSATLFEKSLYWILLLVGIIFLLLSKYRYKNHIAMYGIDDGTQEEINKKYTKKDLLFYRILGLIIAGITIFLIYKYF
ncbi:hypothetical protein IT403_03035 [Candidatus Nomurabacteria bacterium]|nr:hypothetical protein [Candidatus Nomurabacteria bacterium]